jgi:hypothetical protein
MDCAIHCSGDDEVNLIIVITIYRLAMENKDGQSGGETLALVNTLTIVMQLVSIEEKMAWP